MSPRLWGRWKRLAHRAAEAQSTAVLFVLYWIAVVPIGVMVGRRRSRASRTQGWTQRPPAPRPSIDDVRRQF